MVEGENGFLCALSGKEIVLVLVLMQGNLCAVFSYGNLINNTTTLSNQFHEKIF